MRGHSPVADAGRSRAVFFGVGLTSLVILLLELTLTRLFSATMYYHFAFLAISLALFGSGASGVLIYVFQRHLPAEHTPLWLGVSSLLFSLSTIVFTSSSATSAGRGPHLTSWSQSSCVERMPMKAMLSTFENCPRPACASHLAISRATPTASNRPAWRTASGRSASLTRSSARPG